MKRLGLTAGIASIVVLACFHTSAFAGTELVIEADQSQMLTLPAAPGAIIVGNPSIADVTTQGDKLFVHARSFGQTNLLILDQKGAQIAAFDVMIRHQPSSTLAVFKGTSRFSYSCAPLCEAEMQAGDQKDFFEATASAAQKKLEIATGSSSTEAKAPTAPQ